MEEFANGGKDQREKYFGYRLLPARMVIACEFSRLKARLSFLKCGIDFKLDNLPQCITNSCFILHNFFEIRNICSLNYT